MTYKDDELLKFKLDHYNRKLNHSLDHLPYTMTTAEGIGLIYGILESHNLNLNTLLSTILILSGYVAGGLLTLTPVIFKYLNLKKVNQEIIKYCEDGNNEGIISDEKLKTLYDNLKEKEHTKILKIK